MGQRNGLRSRAARAARAHVIAARFGRAVTAMVLALGFLAVGMPATPAAAVQATGGTARFPSIEWFSWGADGATIPNTGITRTENYTLAGQPFNITCTLSNINRTVGTGTGSYLESYRSGTWQGDGFDSLYNIGGVDAANTMVVGLSNHTQGNTITVDFTCSATLAGNAFPLAGLVMADAEASGGTEYVGATIPTSATWRILDRVRGANCNLDTYARRTVVGAANRLELYGPANNTCENGAADVRPGPSSVAFMDGSSSATNVTIAGSGKSAIALGVAFNTDFGDAPASYGNAGAALQYSYTGGDVPVTPSTDTLAANRGTPVFGSITLATNVQPSPRLGASVDPEATQLYSANATGDDVDGEPASGGPDDENGITISNPVEVAPGTNLSVGPIACTGSGFIGGWIDWNLNGVFDGGEKSTNSPACTANAATLTFAVPSGILPSGGKLNSFLRIRFAPTAAQLTPTGITTGGEVEDYRFVAGAKARVILRKTTLGGFGGPYGFTLTNTAQLTGTATTTAAGTAVQIDGNTAVAGSDPFLVATTGTAVTINESSIPAGWALSSVTCNDGTDNVGSLSGTTFTVPGSATGPGSIVTCDFKNGQPAVGLTNHPLHVHRYQQRPDPAERNRDHRSQGHRPHLCRDHPRDRRVHHMYREPHAHPGGGRRRHCRQQRLGDGDAALRPGRDEHRNGHRHRPAGAARQPHQDRGDAERQHRGLDSRLHLPRHQHRQPDPHRRHRHGPDRRSGQLPGDNARPGCVHHLHEDLHAHPGRRERRCGQQHGHRGRYPADRRCRNRDLNGEPPDHARRDHDARQAGGDADRQHRRLDDRLHVHRHQHRQRDAHRRGRHRREGRRHQLPADHAGTGCSDHLHEDLRHHPG